jgi:glycosyltransferase involved in cell wall biosynthesis
MADWLQRIASDSTVRPAKGGTELLRDGLEKYTDIAKYEDINIINSTPKMESIRFTKKNLLWQHLNYIDESLAPLRDNSFVKAVDSFVYVSHWQYEKFRYLFQVPTHNAHVIKNAIEPIEFIPKSKDGKLKLIYASTPFRGLDVLLDAFELLNRDDIELDVYSSTLMYGSGYQAAYADVYKDLFDRAANMKNVNYHAYAENSVVRKAMQDAHILAYPSIFEETSCLVMIEAGAAGCDMVTTNLGALLETGSEYAKMIPIQSDKELLVVKYAAALNEAIDNYWLKSNQEKLKEQSDFYNNNYSWELRALEWNRLFEQISTEYLDLPSSHHPSIW